MLSLRLKDNPEHILNARGFPCAPAEHGGGAAALGTLRISPVLYRVESESFYEMDRRHLDEKGDRKTGQRFASERLQPQVTKYSSCWHLAGTDLENTSF